MAKYTRSFQSKLHLITNDELKQALSSALFLSEAKIDPECSILASVDREQGEVVLSALKGLSYCNQNAPYDYYKRDLDTDTGSSCLILKDYALDGYGNEEPEQTEEETDYSGNDADYNEDYDYDDEDYDYYDAENYYLAAGILAGYLNKEYMELIEDDFVTMMDQDGKGFNMAIIDRETGLVAITTPQMEYMRDFYCLGHDGDEFIKEPYVSSCWERHISQIENAIRKTIGNDFDKAFINSDIPIPEHRKEEYMLKEYDFNNGEAFNQIITGETGCGKTYKAINDEIDAERKFAYIAPCRQLAYESFRYYANPERDMLSSGEIKINPGADGNFFGVFESMDPERLKEMGIDTLIIDEAHFIKDRERGKELSTLIAACRENDINMKLLTATQSFSLNDFEEVHLDARFKVPEKKEVSYEEAIANVEKGMQTLWFCGSIRDTEEMAQSLANQGINAAAMNSSLTPSERMKVQIAFENKEIQVVCTTNVLAQGVNFECENLIIEPDMFETPEQFQQKIGRLGRPGTLNGKNEVYYNVARHMPDVKKDENITKISKEERDNGFVQDDLERCIYEIKYGDEISYSEVKYCIPEFKEFAREFLDKKKQEQAIKEQVIKEERLNDMKDCKAILEKLTQLNQESVRLGDNCEEAAIRRFSSFVKDLGTASEWDVRDCSAITSELQEIYGTFTTSPVGHEAVDSHYHQSLDSAFELFMRKKAQFMEFVDKFNKGLEHQESLIIEKAEKEWQDYCNGDYLEQREKTERALNMIEQEQEALKEIILTNMRRPTQEMDKTLAKNAESSPDHIYAEKALECTLEEASISPENLVIFLEQEDCSAMNISLDQENEEIENEESPEENIEEDTDWGDR